MACARALRPARVEPEPVELRDVSVRVPSGTYDVDGDGRADAIDGARAWADLDGDGDDDVLVDDGQGGVVFAGSGVRADPDLVNLWPGDLDGVPGGDAWLPRPDGRIDVFSGRALVRGQRRRTAILPGLPRALARLDRGGPLETLLLLPGGDGAAFAPVRRPTLEAPGLGPSERVTWLRLVEEDGRREVALTVDRRTAVWPVPARCR